jgi:hypothetical protein
MPEGLGPAEKEVLLNILTSQPVAADSGRLLDSLTSRRLVFATPEGLALTTEGRVLAMAEARSRDLLTESAQ